MAERRKRLQEIVDELAPGLSAALAYNSYTSRIPDSLQFRYTQCGLASAALQLILQHEMGITTARMIKRLEKAPRGPNSRIQSHVVLGTDDEVIDPTCGQFMSYVGLTPRIAEYYSIDHLYPNPQIMTCRLSEMARFALRFSDHAHTVDEEHLVPQPEYEYPPDGSLRGATKTKKDRVYLHIWDPSGYEPFPIDQQPEMQIAATRVVAVFRDIS